MKISISKIGTHALFFQAPAFTPVPDAPSAGFGEQIIDDPDGDDGAKIWARIFDGGAEQAADRYEKEDKK